MKTVAAFIVLSALFSPEVAWAFQSHPAPEGLYVHQLAHVIFSVAMGILAYWLQVNSFVQQRGWRLIQISCILFVLWNFDTFLGHWVEERVAADAVIGEPDWTQTDSPGFCDDASLLRSKARPPRKRSSHDLPLAWD